MLLLRPLRFFVQRQSLVFHFHASPAYSLSRKVLQKFKLADIGEGITECEVIKWNVKVQGTVEAFDPLCEVQSDKASVEITSPFDGTVKELLVQEGEVAKVGQGLCLIEVEEESLDDADPSVITPVDGDTAQGSPQAPMEEQSTTTRRVHPMDPSHQSLPSSESSVNDANVLATPSVRHLARQNHINLSNLVPGSGKDGRIEKKDVETYLASGGVGSEANPGYIASEKDVVVEFGRTRYGMWKAMEKSLEIPHFGYSTTLDLTSLHNLLPTLNTYIPVHFLPPSSTPSPNLFVNPAALHPPPTPPTVPESGRFTKLTYLPVLLKCLSKAMLEWPLLRSAITPGQVEGKPTLTIRSGSDISIALSTPTGLYTPTITSAQQYSVYSLASRLKHLGYLGRQVPSALTPKEMPRRGGTITVSNVGAIGAGDYASPILVPGGGVAIVAIGRAKWVWDVDTSTNGGKDEGAKRLKVGVSWSADHRVVEGAELAAFVQSWREWVEKPERLIGEGV